LISRGAVMEKLLISANSKKYAMATAASTIMWKREIGSRSSRLAALLLCIGGPSS
jgi:hypothetical protein